MTDDDKLIEALTALDPPRRDVRFRAAVMERIARRRFLIEIGAGCAGLALALLLLWLSGPELAGVLNAAVRPLAEPGSVLIGLALAAFLGHRVATRGLAGLRLDGGRS